MHKEFQMKPFKHAPGAHPSTGLTAVVLAMALLLGACSSTPTNTDLLTQARSDLRMAQANPAVARYAALELNQAAIAMDEANAASNHNASLNHIDQLAYVARQKVALAMEIARKNVAEADAATALRERDAVQLAQRTAEANAAIMSAERAKASADRSRTAAQIAQGEAMDAQRAAEEARRATEEARRRTEASQLVASQTQMRNAQLEAQLAELAAKQTPRGLVITLSDVLFATDLSALSQNGMRTVQKLADVLQQNPQRRVLIEGFTDSTGSVAYNQDLSERRASSVRAALQDMGVPNDRVAVRGYGESYPVAANDSSANRQMNRRVEILLSDETGRTLQR
jgi:outer membrane protein OmpA-like peptidoglycan-associated protein